MRCDECDYCHSVDYSGLVPQVNCTRPRQNRYPNLYEGCRYWVKRRERKKYGWQHTIRSRRTVDIL